MGASATPYADAIADRVSPAAKRHAGERYNGNADSLPNEFQRQLGNDERGEKERQEPLSGTPEGDDLALGGVES